MEFTNNNYLPNQTPAETVILDRARFTASLVKHLNPEQKMAVVLPKISSLVLAGAGSGKTTVIINRIANLVNEGIQAKAIMAVTFTNKASEEMKNRLKEKLKREEVAHIWTGTFHSLCLRMLRENYVAAGLPKNFAVLDTDSQESLIKTITTDRNGLAVAGENEGDQVEKILAKDVVKYINSKKEFGIGPYDIDVDIGSTDSNFVELYIEYQVACKDQGLLDFSDLLYRTVELLETDEKVRGKYNTQFDAIMVDEFQDTNNIQYRWLKAIKRRSAFIMAVGDDDQSIYAFRGANPENMQRFVQEMTVDKDNPDGLVIRLERNYRSLPYILESANAVINRNTGRLGKKLWTNSPDKNEKIEVMSYENGTYEARGIAAEINDLIKNKNIPPNEIAVLYRTNMQSRQIEQESIKLGIPVTVYGGFRFYAREEIKHVLAYLDLISSVDRDISFARIINFPVRGIGERTVEDLRQEAKSVGVSMVEMIARRMDQEYVGMSNAEIKKQKAMEEFVGLIIDLGEESARSSLSEIVSKVVEMSGMGDYYRAQPKEEAAERLENIGELISAARQFEFDRPELKGAIEQLPEYLSSVQLLTSTSDADMDKKNTVSLMTVHSAKGLEFDYVYVSGMEDGIFPHFRSIADEINIDAESILTSVGGKDLEYDEDGNLTEESVDALHAIRDDPKNKLDTPELQEERRLLYVALTRARKGLKLSSAKNRMTMGKETVQKQSRFVIEIPENRVKFISAKKPTFDYSSHSKNNSQKNETSPFQSTKEKQKWGNKKIDMKVESPHFDNKVIALHAAPIVEPVDSVSLGPVSQRKLIL